MPPVRTASKDNVSVIPTVTVAQMREVDRIMVDELHIELLQMMENAGRCLAAHTRSWLSGQLAGPDPSRAVTVYLSSAKAYESCTTRSSRSMDSTEYLAKNDS